MLLHVNICNYTYITQLEYDYKKNVYKKKKLESRHLVSYTLIFLVYTYIYTHADKRY